MFIGHNAVGFASKAAAPRASLGLLMAAPMLLDLIWPVFVLLGVEKVKITPDAPTPFLRLEFVSYPWSHSLLMACVWAALFGGGYFLRTRSARAAWIIAIGVVSHWVFDFITHKADLPLWPGGPKAGLGLWYSTSATIVVESLIYIAGVALYLRATKALDVAGSMGAWSLIILLALAYPASILGGAPPNVTAMAWGALALAVIPFWAAWFDRHRTATP